MLTLFYRVLANVKYPMSIMKYNHYLLHLLVPLLAISFPFIWYGIVGTNIMLQGELGIIENMTVLFLLVSIIICLFSLFHLKLKNNSQLPSSLSSLLFIWLSIMLAGATYFFLEEISYGQHFFAWDTSETWQKLNDQNETNLHNTHAIFDQLPRFLLQIALLIGGIILPIHRYFRNVKLKSSDKLYWLLPTHACLLVSLCVIFIRPVLKLFDVEFISAGEMKEMLIALFIMIYCITIRRRLTTVKTPK